MSRVDIAVVDSTQILLPISEQQHAVELARENVRLLNCWLGISTKEDLGNTFCVGCEFLNTCKRLYRLLDGRAGVHPSARARITMEKFGISSEYL